MNNDFIYTLIIYINDINKCQKDMIENILKQDFDFSKIQLILIEKENQNIEIKCEKFKNKFSNNIKYLNQNKSFKEIIPHIMGDIVHILNTDKINKDLLNEVEEFFKNYSNEIDVVNVIKKSNETNLINENQIIDIKKNHYCPKISPTSIFIKKDALIQQNNINIIDSTLIKNIILKKGKYGLLRFEYENEISLNENKNFSNNNVSFIKKNTIEDKNEIFTLWISDEGEYLPELAILSLKSMILTNHNVILYTYAPLKNIPKGVIVKDANEIYDKSRIFKYKEWSRTYSGFANMFRLKRLYEYGGTWMDLDIILIKNINEVITEDIAICSEPHQKDYIHCNNAILRFPKGDPFIKNMLDFAEEIGEDVKHGQTGPHLITKHIFAGEYSDYAQFLKTPIFNNLCGWWAINEYFNDPRILLQNVDLSEVIGFHLVNTYFSELKIENKDVGLYGLLKNDILNSNTPEEYFRKINNNPIFSTNIINYTNLNNLSKFNSNKVKITFLIDSTRISKRNLYLIIGSIEKSNLDSFEIIIFGLNDISNERLSYKNNLVFINSFDDLKSDVLNHINGEFIIPINESLIFKNNCFNEIFLHDFEILRFIYESNIGISYLNVFKQDSFNKLIEISLDIYKLPDNTTFKTLNLINNHIYSLEPEKSLNEQKLTNLIDYLFEFDVENEEFEKIKKEARGLYDISYKDTLSYHYLYSYNNLINSNSLTEFNLNYENQYLKSYINWYNLNNNNATNMTIKEKITSLEKKDNENKNNLIKQKEKNNDLNKTLKNKEQTIIDQNNKIQENNTTITNLNNKIQENNTTITNLNNKIQENEKTIKKMTDSVENKETTINELSSQINNKNRVIKQNTLKISQLETKNMNLNKKNDYLKNELNNKFSFKKLLKKK